MIGDMGNGALTWLSPIGGVRRCSPMRETGGGRFLLLLVLTTVLLVGASQLEARARLRCGTAAPTLGKRRPPPATPPRWGWRCGCSAIRSSGWTAAVVLGGALMGSVVEAMTDLLADAGAGAESLLRGTGVTALLALLVSMMALITVVFALQTTVSLRSDEASASSNRNSPARSPAGAGPWNGWPSRWCGRGAVGPRRVRHRRGVRRFHPRLRPGRAAGTGGIAYWPAVMVFVGLAVLLWGYVPRVAIPTAWA